jgi:hypothetical protein
MKGQLFRVRTSSGWEQLSFQWRENICREVATVHFFASLEFIDNMEEKWIPHNGKHEFFRVKVVLRDRKSTRLNSSHS